MSGRGQEKEKENERKREGRGRGRDVGILRRGKGLRGVFKFKVGFLFFVFCFFGSVLGALISFFIPFLSPPLIFFGIKKRTPVFVRSYKRPKDT